MILISAGLVVTAIVLLIAGFVLAKPFLVMWSIAVSVLSAVFLVIGALLRRHELFPGGGHAGSAPLPSKGPVPAGPMPAPHMMPDPHVPPAPYTTATQGTRPTAVATHPRMSPAPGRIPSARQGLLDAKAIVVVIPGRKRYHVAGCRQLVGRDHEELTHEEAREEGFTPCTTCLPEFTGGKQPQDTPRGVQEPAAPLAPPSKDDVSADTSELGVDEPTARFNPPYRPVTSSDPQEVAPVARLHVQDAPAPQERAQPQEPVSPSLRAAQPVERPAQAQPPVPPSETSADSEVTSWFSRDVAKAAAATPEGPAGPTPSGDSRDETPAEPEAAPPGSTEVEAPAEADSPAPPEPAGDETPAASSGTGPAGSDGRPGSATRESSPEKQDPIGEPVSAEPDSTPDPVEPAETASGRAGQPVPADSTPEEAETSAGRQTAPEEAPDEDGEDADTSPHGIPVVQDGPDPGGPGTVKVIVGTRRFHSSACPLIRGTDDSGIETMSRAEAEEAGLSGCSVCRDG
ncbi:hypothetical protein [Streptosporangium sp. NPDC087985]|uniref:hypothetical protein n=1 Tax=Streptosporangium sp. NPDC087985 TaxID=3366196 RepID=UPI0038089086